MIEIGAVRDSLGLDNCSSVNVDTGVASPYFLSLDQGMIMAALGNHLGNDVLRKAFVTTEFENRLRPVMAMERFSATPR